MSHGPYRFTPRMQPYAFEVALTRTDAVVQPRQSNTWGALSLDHVYEFMGGLKNPCWEMLQIQLCKLSTNN